MTIEELFSAMMSMSDREAKMAIAYLAGILRVAPDKPLNKAIEASIEYETWMIEKDKA